MRRSAGLAVLAALAVPGSAAASWSPATLVSQSTSEQGSAASIQPDVSDDGRYVAFATRSRTFFGDPDPPGVSRVGGVFRKDLATGALELVATGELEDRASAETVRGGAVTPSISGDGRYVAFATPEALVGEDTNGRFDVYVRDMTTGAVELASAQDGSSTPATYEGGGSIALPSGSALSADGRKVVFSTQAQSSLPAGGAGTPAGQVFVRDLDRRTTTLVTVGLDGTPAGGGNAFAGLALSADGMTVVWNGREVRRQTEVLEGETQDPAHLELLWRRPGPGATTRRVADAADPEDPGCPPGGAITRPTDRSTPPSSPCDGPFSDRSDEGNGGRPFALDRTGTKVAFISSGQLRGVVQPGDPGVPDAFLADMSAPSRKRGVRELTREGQPSDQTASRPIDQIGLSANGRVLALTTGRTKFVLATPTLLGRGGTGSSSTQTYAVDLAGATMRLLTAAPDGAPGQGNDEPGSSPAMSADGRRIVLASGATNLVTGDGNGALDAFAFDRLAPDDQPLGTELTPLAPLAPSSVPWVLRASPRATRDGRLELLVLAPAAGRVRVTATTRSGTRRAVLSVTRTVAEAGRLRVRATAARALRPAVRRRGGLPVRLRVRFTPAAGQGGRGPLTVSLDARLRARTP